MALDSLQWLRGELADLGQVFILVCNIFVIDLILLLDESSFFKVQSVSNMFQPSARCRQEFTKLSDSLVACPASKLGVLATITKRQSNSKISILPFRHVLRLESRSILANRGKN